MMIPQYRNGAASSLRASVIMIMLCLVSFFVLTVNSFETRDDERSSSTSSRTWSSSEASRIIATRLGLPLKRSSIDVEASLGTNTNYYESIASLFHRDTAGILYLLPQVERELLQVEQLSNTRRLSTSITSISEPVSQGIPTLNYESNGKEATVVDVLAQIEHGKSLIYSQAMDFEALQTIATSNVLLGNNKQHNNIAYFWNAKIEGFNTYHNNFNNDLFLLNRKNILAMINTHERDNSLSSYFKDIKVYANSEQTEIIAEKNMNDKVVYNISSKNAPALLFFAEILQLITTSDLITTDRNLISLLNDNHPDLFLFAIQSPQLLRTSYGAYSYEYRTAVELLNHVINIVSQRISVATDKNDDCIQNCPHLFASIILTIATLKRAVTGAGEMEQFTSDYVLQEYYVANNSNSTTAYDATNFQLVLWTAIGLIAAVLASVALLLVMDRKEDTLLYRTYIDIQMQQEEKHRKYE